jgi:hypothetical protein
MKNTNNPILIGDRVQYDNSIGCTSIGMVVKIDEEGAWIQPENYGDDPDYLKDGLLGVGHFFTFNPENAHYSQSIVRKLVDIKVMPYPAFNSAGVKKLISDIAEMVHDFGSETKEEDKNIIHGLELIIRDIIIGSV